MKNNKPKRPRGRPSGPEVVQLMVRVEPPIAEKIRGEAKSSGKTISRIIADRFEDGAPLKTLG